MNLDTFIEDIKRKTQYGSVSVITDKQTADILAATVDSLDLIAKYWPWDWLTEPVTITLVTNVTDYTLATNIEALTSLKDADDNRVYYDRIGRNTTTGARKIRLTSSHTSDLVGFGKKKLTRFVAADLGTAKSFLPFPDDNAFVLKAFVLAEVLGYQGKPAERLTARAEAMALLKSMSGQEATDPANPSTSKVPGYYAAKQAARRGGRVV
jgi:hypothetical protein